MSSMFCKRYCFRVGANEKFGFCGGPAAEALEKRLALGSSNSMFECCQKRYEPAIFGYGVDMPEKANFDVHRTNRQGQTALHVSSKQGFTNCVSKLLKLGARTETFDADDMTPLMYAARYGHPAVVICLVKGGANVNLSNSKGELALHYSCLGGHGECTELLLHYGSKPNYPDDNGTTPLILACCSNNVRVVRVLLDAGAKPDKVDNMKRSALHWAALSCNKDITDALIAAGASLDLMDKYYATAFMYSIFNNNSSVLKSLVDSGCDSTAIDGLNGTALTLASLKGHDTCVRVLLSAGEDPNEFSYFGMTALMASVYESHYDVTQTILQYKPNVNIVSRLGFTALFAALCHINEGNARMRHKLLVLLLQHGADVNQRFGSRTAFSNVTNGNNSPILFAVTTGYLSLVRILLYAGIRVGQDELEYLINTSNTDDVCELPSMLKPIADYKCTPQQLRHLCRLAIRKTLGRDVRLGLDRLPIPNIMKDYLNFSDLVEVQPERTQVKCTFHDMALTMLNLKACGLQAIEGSYLFDQLRESVLQAQQPGPCHCDTCVRIRQLQHILK